MCFYRKLPAASQTYTLSLHDALPIYMRHQLADVDRFLKALADSTRLRILGLLAGGEVCVCHIRSEEHTSELQSLTNLVCRLLLEKKKIYADRCMYATRTHCYSLTRGS